MYTFFLRLHSRCLDPLLRIFTSLYAKCLYFSRECVQTRTGSWRLYIGSTFFVHVLTQKSGFSFFPLTSPPHSVIDTEKSVYDKSLDGYCSIKAMFFFNMWYIFSISKPTPLFAPKLSSRSSSNPPFINCIPTC